MPSIPNARRHSSSSGERVSITSNRAIRPTLRIRGGKLLMMDLRRLNVPSSACIEGGSSSQVHRVVLRWAKMYLKRPSRSCSKYESTDSTRDLASFEPSITSVSHPLLQTRVTTFPVPPCTEVLSGLPVLSVRVP